MTNAPSEIEDMLAVQMKMAKLPEPEREWAFDPDQADRRRQWQSKFDFAWPGHKIAVEVEGGTWGRGRHTSGAGFERDCVKYNRAHLLGWTVYRVTSSMVKDGRALATIDEALK